MVSKNIPTKLYYSISEVADQFGVNQSLIRYWEKVFPQIKPRKSSNGVRRFTPNDLAILQKIYTLLKVDGYTIEGAKAQLKQVNKQVSSPLTATQQKDQLDQLYALRSRLLALKSSLDALL